MKINILMRIRKSENLDDIFRYFKEVVEHMGLELNTKETIDIVRTCNRSY